jgi:PAS domain S-box-containing protein
MTGAGEITAEQLRTGGVPTLVVRRRYLTQFLTIFVAYFSAATAGLAWATTSGAASPVWPAAGVALAGLAIAGRAHWPAIALGLIAAMQVTGATHGLLSHLTMALGNSAAAAIGATLLNRIAGTPAPTISRLPHAMGLLFAGLVAAGIAALIGVLALAMDGALPWAAVPEVLPTWFFGDAVGAFIVAALILSWRSRPWLSWRSLDWFHLVLVLAAAAAGAWYVFYGEQSARAFLIYPVLVWAALIHYTPGATAALVVTAAVAIGGTSIGSGPFGSPGSSGDLVLLQQFLAVSALTVLLLAAVGDERQTETRARMEAAESLAASRLEELNSLYESAPIGLAFFSRDYRYLRINNELAAINGVSAKAHVGRTIHEVLSDQAPTVEPVIDQVFATGLPVRDMEVSGETPQQPGKIRHWLTGFYPVFAGDGSVEAVGAWVIEISERKAAEEREVMLAREVDHRAKNLLSVVQAVVQMTRAEDSETQKARITERIQALSRAHNLLSASRWEGVELQQLVADELAPYAAGEASRVHVSGPALCLSPPAAQSIGLVIHELATNAAKYGSLRDGGRIEVRWRRDMIADQPVVVLEWAEHGGPPATPPTSTGFGSKIIRAGVERQLRGLATYDWSAEGLRCRFEIPEAQLVATLAA